MFDPNRFYKLEGCVQHYAWGEKASGASKPFIAEFLNLPAGESPWAELWLGAHPKMPSAVVVDGEAVALDKLIAEEPVATIGEEAKTACGILPFLLKVLSCGAPLSIQSHPDKKTAKRLHDIHPDWYPDDNHKPEMMLALTEIEAMCGLRGCTEIENDLAAHEVLRGWLAKWHVDGAANAGLKGLCRVLFEYAQEEIVVMCNQLQKELQEKGCLNDADALFLKLLEFYPHDRGAFFGYLLNHVRLQPGEAVFMAANQPHTYIKGTGIECTANSDNVIRAGLTSKVIDVDTLMNTLDFFPEPLKIMRSVTEAPGVKKYISPIDEFELTVLTGAEYDGAALGGKPAIVLVLSGNVEMAAGGVVEIGGRGMSWFKPAAMQAGKISYVGDAVAVIAYSNL